MTGFSWWLSGKESLANAGDTGSIPGLERSLKKKMATNSSILVWEITWTENSGGLQSTGLHKSWIDLATKQHQNSMTNSTRPKGGKWKYTVV